MEQQLTAKILYSTHPLKPGDAPHVIAFTGEAFHYIVASIEEYGPGAVLYSKQKQQPGIYLFTGTLIVHPEDCEPDMQGATIEPTPEQIAEIIAEYRVKWAKYDRQEKEREAEMEAQWDATRY